jgi:1-acyl-sn-glycerol-3-phosphate acyltransferase
MRSIRILLLSAIVAIGILVLGVATVLTLASGMILLVITTILTLGLAQNWVVEFFSRTLGRLIFWFARVKLKIEYVSKKGEGPTVYISNHSSTLDLFGIMALGLPSTRYVAKYELLYNPFFGVMGVLTGQIFIKRHDSAQAIAALPDEISGDERNEEAVAVLLVHAPAAHQFRESAAENDDSQKHQDCSKDAA